MRIESNHIWPRQGRITSKWYDVFWRCLLVHGWVVMSSPRKTRDKLWGCVPCTHWRWISQVHVQTWELYKTIVHTIYIQFYIRRHSRYGSECCTLCAALFCFWKSLALSPRHWTSNGPPYRAFLPACLILYRHWHPFYPIVPPCTISDLRTTAKDYRGPVEQRWSKKLFVGSTRSVYFCTDVFFSSSVRWGSHRNKANLHHRAICAHSRTNISTSTYYELPFRQLHTTYHILYTFT